MSDYEWFTELIEDLLEKAAERGYRFIPDYTVNAEGTITSVKLTFVGRLE